MSQMTDISKANQLSCFPCLSVCLSPPPSPRPQARDHFDRQQPAEKRIIEYLLTVTDPTERRNLLDKAITPGPIRMTETHDYLYSTPQVSGARTWVGWGGAGRAGSEPNAWGGGGEGQGTG